MHFFYSCRYCEVRNTFWNMPGRAGRVSKGYCYRLVTKHFWDKEIPDHMIPDMQVSVQPPFYPSQTLQPPLAHLQLQHWQNEMAHTLFDSSSSKLAPLSTIVLKVKLLDIGDPRTILSTALSPPNLSGIVNTVLQLKEVLEGSQQEVLCFTPFNGNTNKSQLYF